MRRQTTQTTLICTECGYIFPIMRNAAKQKKTFHVKDLYCPKCKDVTKHFETKDWFIVYEIISSKEVEKLMFGSETYLEENAFSTGHQNVNVYNLPEKCYEIRSEDYSIDIQVHKEK